MKSAPDRACGPASAVKRSGSMPSASRNPISRNSSATSPGWSFSSTMRPWPCASTRVSQRFRALLGFGGVAAAVDIEPSMRARPDAGIFVPAPINQIVPALGARPRVVGNFVSRQACAGADQLREIVKIAPQIVVGNRELARLVQPEERRAGLDGQLIERQMLGRFRDRALEFGGPGLQRLARARINQIERITLEDRARDRDRVERLLRGVQPAEFLERAHRRAPARRATRG